LISVHNNIAIILEQEPFNLLKFGARNNYYICLEVFF
jgi:hypothetical protein